MKLLLILAVVLWGPDALGETTPPQPLPASGTVARDAEPVRLETTFPDRVEDHRARDGAGEELEVLYYPTPIEAVRAVLELARVGPGDVLYDLGCGDGRIVIAAAAERGARGVGVDLDPRRIEESNLNAAAFGVENLVDFRVQDLFETDFSEASVVALYLLPEVNIKLRPLLLEQLRPGSRVVSHDHQMGDWAPEHRVPVQGPEYPTELYLWLIPAPVEGEWIGTLGTGSGELPLKFSLGRRFQRVWGTVRVSGEPGIMTPGRIFGKGLALESMNFSLEGEWVKAHFLGEVEGDRASGLVLIEGGRRAGVHPWRVTRPGSDRPLPVPEQPPE